MKICLVTGGAGYIGSHTCVELVRAGYNIVVIDNLISSDINNIKSIEKISSSLIPFYNIDLCNKKSLINLFNKYNFDAVIHFAALKSINESIANPLSYYTNNINGTLNLCEVMNMYNVKNMIFSSSASVYGNIKENPITEEHELLATNPYSRTKLIIENILTDLFVSDNKWSINILRYFNPIGAHESGLIGDNPIGIPSNLMPYITQVASGKRDILKIYGNDYDTYDGTGVRDYIHVVDLAKGHIKALNKIFSNKGFNVYNLGTGKGYSVLELIDIFQRVTGNNINYQIVSRRDGDIAICYADPSKAINELGWQAEKGIEDMCRDSWRYQINN